MDLRKIKKLIDLLEESNLAEIEIKEGEESVRLGNPKGVLPYSVLVSADGRLLRQRIGPFAAGEITRWAAANSPD